jgi:hypothetical protein
MTNMETFQKQNQKLVELGVKLKEFQNFDFKVSLMGTVGK